MSFILKLLGGFQITDASGNVIALPKKAEALFAYLAINISQPQMRDKLAVMFWGHTDGEHARSSLRQTLYVIRKSLGKSEQPLFAQDGDVIILNAEAFSVDVWTYQKLIEEGTAESLEQAITLQNGELLDGFSVSARPFEDWLLIERERIREMGLDALAKLLAQQMKSGHTQSAIRIAIRLLSLDPLQESVYRALMRLYARQGRWAAAQRQYQLCVDTLRRELGITPEPETAKLYEEILAARQEASSKETRSNVETQPNAMKLLDGENDHSIQVEVLQAAGPAAARVERRSTWFERVGGAKPAVFILFLATAVWLTYYFWQSEIHADHSQVHALAVLPFELVDGYKYEEQLGIQLADAVITRLTKDADFEVRSTSAIIQYRGKVQDPAVVGEELGVDAVLQGRIQMLGDKMRLSLQLVAVSDSAPVWAEQFDERFSDLLRVQDSIAERVCRQLMQRFGKPAV